MKTLTSLPSLLALFCLACPAAAEPGPDSVPPPSSAPSVHSRRELRASAGAGVFSATPGGGFLLDAEVMHRRGLLALAGAFDYGTAVIMPARSYGLSGGAGISVPTVPWLRIDLLGVGGVRRYEGVGGLTLFGVQNPGVDALLPHLGVRGGVSLELGTDMKFVLGVRGAIDRDLGTSTKTSTTRSAFFTEDSPVTVGGTRISGLFTLGGTFEL